MNVARLRAALNSLKVFHITFAVLSLFYIAQLTGTSFNIAGREGPDERHHFSLVVFFLENPLIYFDRTAIKAERYDYNHLIHPPFYYYIVAKAASIVYPELGDAYFSKRTDVFKAQEIFWSRAFRFVSMVIFTPIYLVGVYFALRKLLFHQILTVPTAFLSFVVWSFLASRLMAGSSLSNDAMALALWPWLLYLILCSLYGGLGLRVFYWVSIIVITLALMTKITLFPLVFVVALVALYGATKIVNEGLGSRSTLRLWSWQLWQEFASKIGPFNLILGIAVVTIPLASMGTDFIRYGSISPALYQVYPELDVKYKFYSQDLADNPWSFSRLALHVIDRMWSSAVGVYSHHFYYITGSGPLNGVRFLIWSVSLFVIGAVMSSLTQNSRNNPWPLVTVGSISYVMFMVLFIFQMYHVMLTRAGFAAQGRYTIGYLELALLATVVAGVALVRALRSRPRTKLAAAVGVYFGLGLLVILLARPWGLTGYSVSFASQDGSGTMLIKERVVPASAISFQGSGLRVAKARGRDGAFNDAEAMALVSSAPAFDVTASVSPEGLRPGKGSKQPDVCMRHSLLVSADRSVRVVSDRSDEVIIVRPYRLVPLPVAFAAPAEADQPIPIKLQIALDENPVDWVRNLWRTQTFFFVYGLLAERCSIPNPLPRAK